METRPVFIRPVEFPGGARMLRIPAALHPEAISFVAVVAALFLASSVEAQAPGRAYDPIVRGALDVHTHPAPDMQERSTDAIEYARLAKEAGI